MRLAATALLALILVAAPRAASAGGPGDGERSRELFRLGQERFQAGEIEAAIAAFAEGYALDPRPEFLLNLAQSYRALGRRAEAITYFERFIAAAPDHALRPAAERTLAELRRAEEEEAAARRAREPAPRPLPLVPAGGERSPVADDTAPRSGRSWLWVAVGAAVVVGGGVALYFAMRGGDDDVIDTIRLPDP